MQNILQGTTPMFQMGNYSLNATDESIDTPSTNTNNGTSGGSLWDKLLTNAGTILGGIASNVNAIKGNTPTYNVNVPQQQQKMDYTMIIVIVIALLFLTGITIVLIKKGK